MNKKTLLLGVIVGIIICYGIYLGYICLASPKEMTAENRTYTYVLTNRNLKKYEKITSNDIVEISTQDDKLGEIKLTKQINSNLLDISSNEFFYLSLDINKNSILQDEFLLTYDEVINKKKEEVQNLNQKILEIESMNKKEEEGFDVDDNSKASYENILKSFDISKEISLTVQSNEFHAQGKLIEITNDHALVALNEDDYNNLQNIKDTELITIKLNYN